MRGYKLGRDALKVEDFEIAKAQKGVHLKYDKIDALEIQHQIELNNEEQNEADFTSYLCYTGKHNPSDYQCLKGPDGNRIGWIFPANTYSEKELIEDMTIWAKKFAEVGFRQVTTSENIINFSVFDFNQDMPAIGIRSLSDTFTEEISVLVLSRNAIAKLSMSDMELELALILSGIYCITDTWPIHDNSHLRPHQLKQKLQTPSHHFKEEPEHFVKLFRYADKDPTGVGAFLAYYQVIEWCITFVLSWTIEDITKETFDAWALKELLNESTNEKRRFNKIPNNYISRNCNHDIFDELKTSSLEILKMCDINISNNNSWCDVVYKVRNLVVHNQIKLYKTSAIDKIHDLNIAMRKSCIEIITHFTKEPSK